MHSSNKFIRHLQRWRPAYIGLPVAVILLAVSISTINWLTGRPTLDSPEQIVGTLYRFFTCVLGIMLVLAVKSHETLNRPTSNDVISCWKELCVSRGYTALLLYIFLWFLTH